MAPSILQRRAFLATAAGGVGVLAGWRGRGSLAEDAASEQPTDSIGWNVEEHGIEGDGTTEVGTAVHELLAEVDAAGGGIVYFPPGRYLLERTPLIGENTLLVGAGRSTVFEGIRPEGIQGGALLSNVGYDEPGYEGGGNWGIRNVRIDSPDSNGIMPAHAENVQLKDLYGDFIRYHHADIVSSKNVTVDGYVATRGGEGGSDAPFQFDAQREGVERNGIWDGETMHLVEDDDTPTTNGTLRNFTIEPENDPSYGVQLHRGPHESITIRDGTITGCAFTAIRSDPENEVRNLSIRGVSCLENARGITLGHVEDGRRELTIDEVVIRTDEAALAGGSGLYAAGFDGSTVSNVTVAGAFTNTILFDDMRELTLNNVTARGAVDQAFRFRDNVEVTLTTARAADSGGAGIYVGPDSTAAYGGMTFENVETEVVADGELREWSSSSGT